MKISFLQSVPSLSFQASLRFSLAMGFFGGIVLKAASTLYLALVKGNPPGVEFGVGDYLLGLLVAPVVNALTFGFCAIVGWPILHWLQGGFRASDAP